MYSTQLTIFNKYASPSYKNSYGKIVVLNDKPTVKPTYKYQQYSQINDITEEPTEAFIPSPFPSKYTQSDTKINNLTCICDYNKNDNTFIIIAASIPSVLCLILLLTLIWYRFIFKKKLLKWETNEANFGFGL